MQPVPGAYIKYIAHIPRILWDQFCNDFVQILWHPLDILVLVLMLHSWIQVISKDKHLFSWFCLFFPRCIHFIPSTSRAFSQDLIIFTGTRLKKISIILSSCLISVSVSNGSEDFSKGFHFLRWCLSGFWGVCFMISVVFLPILNLSRTLKVDEDGQCSGSVLFLFSECFWHWLYCAWPSFSGAP